MYAAPICTNNSPIQFSGNDNEVDIALVGPYFNTKSKLEREEMYYDVHTHGPLGKIMGSKFDLKFRIKSKVHSTLVFEIDFIQFVLEDELYKCLPIIERSPSQ